MAAQDRPTLTVSERSERGSRAVRRLRRSGLIPGVLYGGGGGEPVSFSVATRDLRLALQDHSQVIDVQLPGQKAARPVILKDTQRHPVRDEIMHLDLLQVRLDEKIHSTVPVELEGAEEAPGAKEGGVLEHVTRELNIEALPTDLPERLVVDVSGMEAAATMHLSEIEAPAGVTFLDDLEETIIATVTVPSEVEEETEIEEETELVGEAEQAAAAGEESSDEGGGEGGGEES
jgi:large subunit ribosomal protein L25